MVKVFIVFVFTNAILILNLPVMKISIAIISKTINE